MCAQCMAGAATAMTAATGARAWIAAKGGARLTQRRLRFVTRGLLGLAVVAAAFVGAGTG